MKQSTTVVLSVLLIVGVAVAVNWLVRETPEPPTVAVGHETLADDLQIGGSEPVLEADEQRGIGNLVIALTDGAQFPLFDEQVRISATGHEADDAIVRTDHRGEAVFAGIVEGAYLYTVEASGRPLLVASDPVFVEQGETTLLTLRV